MEIGLRKKAGGRKKERERGRNVRSIQELWKRKRQETEKNGGGEEEIFKRI